ncbi:MAG: DUF6638 family protein [Pseudomonadota bacterium]
MMRLVRRGLMFGNLIEVRSPALVERYNRALEHLTGKRTGLSDFHIDISGFSPEVGDELGDPLYLNPGGCNRQFIILTTEQKTAPLIDAHFSTSRSILRRWIEANEDQLFVLTARDAVAGELVNSVFSMRDASDLLALREIVVEADTTSQTVEQARALSDQIDRFMAEPDAWWDDVLIARMIETAKVTGDITRNPVTLTRDTFRQGNFWTRHFGGLYIFRDTPETAIISRQPLGDVDVTGWDVDYVMDFTMRTDVATYLSAMGLAEPIVDARGRDVAAILRQKMDFIVADTATALGDPLGDADRRHLRRLARRHADALPEAYHGLARQLNWVSAGGPWPSIDATHDAYFYSLRAADHGDRDLVNMLLAELSPLDVRQLFICHKDAFYAAYRTWPDDKKEYVANYLANEYILDKAGAREALFGHEPPMAEEPAEEDIVARVGPWGAVRRNR